MGAGRNGTCARPELRMRRDQAEAEQNKATVAQALLQCLQACMTVLSDIAPCAEDAYAQATKHDHGD